MLYFLNRKNIISIQLSKMCLLGISSFSFENTLTFRGKGKSEIQNIQDKKYTTLKGAEFGTTHEYDQPRDTLVTQEHSGAL